MIRRPVTVAGTVAIDVALPGGVVAVEVNPGGASASTQLARASRSTPMLRSADVKGVGIENGDFDDPIHR